MHTVGLCIESVHGEAPFIILDNPCISWFGTPFYLACEACEAHRQNFVLLDPCLGDSTMSDR
jgi:hypothetical protein